MLIAMLVAIVVGGVILAARNIRMGRGDRKGAFRIALFVFFLSLSETMFVHHVATFTEWFVITRSLADSLLNAGLFWVLYVAIEPFVRRRWPGRIISWTRLIAGDYRNPMIGRDILIGTVCGMALIAMQVTVPLLPERLGWPSYALGTEPASVMLGLRYAIPALARQTGSALFFGFGFLSLLLLFSIVFRKDRLAVGALWVLSSAALILAWGNPLAFIAAPIGAALLILPLVRFGLLAMISAQFCHHMWVMYPLTYELTAWYASSFVVGVIVFLAVTIYAFYISLAGQPLFRGGFLED